MNWELDPAAMPAYLRLECSGKPNIDDFQAMWDEVLSSGDWTPGVAVLVDNRSLETLPNADAFTMSAIEYFARNSTSFGDSCIAVISDATHNFKYARQFQYGVRLRGSGIKLQVFSSEAQAVQWLEHYCNLRGQHYSAVN